MDWPRLAQAVIDRRVELGYRTRESFAAGTGLSSRLLGDLERGQRDNYDRVTFARLEQALQWPAGAVLGVLQGGRVVGNGIVFDGDPDQLPPNGVAPAFDLDPALAAEVEITEQARRLSWLTGAESPIGEAAARRLAAAVEAVMAMALPSAPPPRAGRAPVPPMSEQRRVPQDR